MRLPMLAAALLAFAAQAQVERLNHVVVASGLTVAFPDHYACPPIASPFASPTRFDGSLRRGDRNSGLHGGLDITLEAGTPLLAVADGEVVAQGEGGMLEGIYLWLRHTPAETGLSSFVFSKYQHLSAHSALKLGERVKAGQPVGLSGATGTAGRHYGPGGYPHLHLTTHFGPSGEYELRGMHRSMLAAEGAHLDDPLALYLGDRADPTTLRALPSDRKTVRPGVVGDDGRIHPEGSKTVWPVACRKTTAGAR